MRVHDRETHYELGKLRALHDRWIIRQYRLHEFGSVTDMAQDAECIYHLDTLDALIEMDADQDGAA